MKKKFLIIIFIIFIILGIVCTKEILFKYYINPKYSEIIEQFKRDYDYNGKISSESLYQYEEFLKEYGDKSDIFIIESYIDGTLSKEETIKNNIYKSKYLSSKILGAELLYKYYLENNKEAEAKELIIDIFNEIEIKYFRDNINEISYFLRVVSSSTDDKDIVIDIFENLIDVNHKSIPDRIKLEIYEKLRFLYIYKNNYALASEAAIQSIIIANQLKLNEKTSEALIELAQLFKRLGGVESAIKLLEKSLLIEVEDEVKNADIKTYGLLTISELYLTIQDYESARLFSDEIPNYKDNISVENYRDIEIVKSIIDARIAIMEDDLELAKELLDYAEYLQEIDEEDYYLGKEVSYSLALGEFYEASNQYEDAIQLYESMLNENKNNNYILEKILTNLIRVEKDANKKNEYYAQIIELQLNDSEERYGDYTFYILDKIENENELIEKNKSISRNYRFIIFLILMGGLIIVLLSQKIKDIKIKNKRDVLVDAYNRRYFDITYKKLLNKNKLFSIIILDLDNFKSINDNFGHELGDIVLKNMCKAIQPILDKESSLFRYGGEEFIVIVKDKSKDDVLELAEKIRAKVQSLTWRENIVTTLSIGVAYSDIDGNNTLNKADENLYVSKKTGKNKVTG